MIVAKYSEILTIIYVEISQINYIKLSYTHLAKNVILFLWQFLPLSSGYLIAAVNEFKFEKKYVLI
jgi:hypothetical protein